MTLQSLQTDREADLLNGLDEASMVVLLRRDADLMDIRFTAECKVCTYRLNGLLIEVKQNRRRLQELSVSVIDPSFR